MAPGKQTIATLRKAHNEEHKQRMNELSFFHPAASTLAIDRKNQDLDDAALQIRLDKEEKEEEARKAAKKEERKRKDRERRAKKKLKEAGVDADIVAKPKSKKSMMAEDIAAILQGPIGSKDGADDALMLELFGDEVETAGIEDPTQLPGWDSALDEQIEGADHDMREPESEPVKQTLKKTKASKRALEATDVDDQPKKKTTITTTTPAIKPAQAKKVPFIYQDSDSDDPFVDKPGQTLEKNAGKSNLFQKTPVFGEESESDNENKEPVVEKVDKAKKASRKPPKAAGKASLGKKTLILNQDSSQFDKENEPPVTENTGQASKKKGLAAKMPAPVKKRKNVTVEDELEDPLMRNCGGEKQWPVHPARAQRQKSKAIGIASIPLSKAELFTAALKKAMGNFVARDANFVVDADGGVLVQFPRVDTANMVKDLIDGKDVMGKKVQVSWIAG